MRHVPGGGPRRRARALFAARKALELWVGDYGNYERVGRHPEVRLSKQRVHQIIQAAIREAAMDRKGLAEFALDKKLLAYSQLKGDSWEIIRRPCPVCEGRTSALGHTPCEACADTGFFYDTAQRLAALDRYLRADQSESDLLGLTEPTRIQIGVDVNLLEQIAAMSEEEHDEIIELYGDDVVEEPELEIAGSSG
jgi:hypothetical protein